MVFSLLARFYQGFTRIRGRSVLKLQSGAKKDKRHNLFITKKKLSVKSRKIKISKTDQQFEIQKNRFVLTYQSLL